ncbi:hypothetical protein ES702_01187 [subsurface metagenome]
MKIKWIKRFDSNHPLINIYVLVTSFGRQSLGAQNKNILVTSKETLISFYRLKQENDKLTSVWRNETLDRKKMLKNIKFSQRAASDMENWANKIADIKLGTINNNQLNKYYQQYVKFFRNIFIAYDMSQPEVPEPAEQYIKNKLTKITGDDQIALEYFLKLTLPSEINLLSKEELDWLKITRTAIKEKTKLKNIRIKKLVAEHSKKYGWISTQENLPFMDVTYYKELLRDHLMSSNLKDVEDSINKIQTSPKKIEENRKKVLHKIRDNKLVAETTDLMRQLGLLRINLRLAWTKGAYFARLLFKEIGRRMNIDDAKVRYLFPDEVEKILLKNSKINIQDINRRQKSYVAMLDNGKFKIFTGIDAKKIIEKERISEQQEEIKKNIFTGTPANPGLAKGSVKIIHSHQQSQNEEVKKMKKGQILVAGSTKPQLMEACRKAIAIVTDEGGILSHAAIVSRELNIPCVIGTKIGTKMLKDGDLIQVDAIKGVIKILKN